MFNTFKVKNYFSLKSRTPFPLSARVVYKYKCLCDANLIYIGKTKRHLATRVKEHKKNPSAIKSHLETCDTCMSDFSIDSFKIIDRANSDYYCKIKESLHIKSEQPTLNTQLITSGASFVLNIFWFLYLTSCLYSIRSMSTWHCVNLSLLYLVLLWPYCK